MSARTFCAALALAALAAAAASDMDSDALVQTKLTVAQEHAPPPCLGATAPLGTNCPDAVWVDAMVRADPEPGKIIMDVGCNKGNDALAWMERWDAHGFWSARKWTSYLGSGLHYACPPGAMRTRGADHRRPAAAGVPEALPVGVCVEPMPTNFALLRNTSHALGYDGPSSHGAFHVVQAAVMDKAAPGGMVSFPVGNAGQEGLGLTPEGKPFVHPKLKNKFPRPSTIRVPRKTVDGLVAELGLPRVDILTIDVEGGDPAVLRGADQTLRFVRYLQFEVHRDLPDTAWAHTTLKSVVADLDARGFDCYWAGNHGRLLTMNRCWNKQFEHGMWANAACVKRADPWAAVLRRFDTMA